MGKTSLVVSYTTNGYPTEYVPTAFDNFSGKMPVNHQLNTAVVMMWNKLSNQYKTRLQMTMWYLIKVCYSGQDI